MGGASKGTPQLSGQGAKKTPEIIIIVSRYLYLINIERAKFLCLQAKSLVERGSPR